MTEIKSLAGASVEMAQNDNRKENLKKGLMIAGGVALAGVSVFCGNEREKKSIICRNNSMVLKMKWHS